MPTAEARQSLAKYCQGNGIDVGYGGIAITPNTINLDLPEKKQHGGNDPQHLFGNGKELYWFKDEVLDYVYSSHLLENFYIPEMHEFLKEWFRVLKPGGLIILYLPDQKVYEEHCRKAGANHNPAHKYKELSLEWFIESVIKPLNKEIEVYKLDIIYKNPNAGKFSFELVLRKG